MKMRAELVFIWPPPEKQPRYMSEDILVDHRIHNNFCSCTQQIVLHMYYKCLIHICIQAKNKPHILHMYYICGTHIIHTHSKERFVYECDIFTFNSQPSWTYTKSFFNFNFKIFLLTLDGL